MELSTELIGFDQDDDVVVATLRHEGKLEQVRADFLVGTDGGRSFVRKHSGVGFVGTTWESERTLIGDVRAEGVDGEFCHMFTGGDLTKRFSLWNLPGSDHYQFVAAVDPDDEPELSLTTVQKTLEERSGRADIRLFDLRWISLYRIIRTLSGGQRRRLDVAVGIVGHPELLFLDEPTAGFDPAARQEFHELVHRLADDDETTILLTTHDLDEVEKLANRILILAGGVLIADGSADQLSLQTATQSEVKWTLHGRRYVHTTAEPTRFVQDLVKQHGDAVAHLEVHRGTLVDSRLRGRQDRPRHRSPGSERETRQGECSVPGRRAGDFA